MAGCCPKARLRLRCPSIPSRCYERGTTRTGFTFTRGRRCPVGWASVGDDVTRARAAGGVVAVITGEHVAKETRPFAVGVTTPVHYYCAATDKVRFVGEPVAVVVARDRYLAEDAAELVEVEYEPLPAVIDPEKALEPDAPVLHDKVGTNLAGHRRLVYGDPERAFREAEVVLRERFRFPKYGSTPIETYGIIARWELDGVCTVWSNFMS